MEKSFVCPVCKNEVAWHQKSRSTQDGKHLCMDCHNPNPKNRVYAFFKQFMAFLIIVAISLPLAGLILFTTSSWIMLFLFLGLFFWLILGNRLSRRKRKIQPTGD